MILAIKTHLEKFTRNIFIICPDVDPKTFRIPISLVFCWVINEDSPRSPKEAINKVKSVKNLKSVSNQL